MKILERESDFTNWAGQNPYFLVIYVGNEDRTFTPFIVDFDEADWMKERPELMRAPGFWALMAKRSADRLDGAPVLMQTVLPGEQPFYTRRHIGVLYGGSGALTSHCIGKKRRDGHVDRMWILPNGAVCPGDDIDDLGVYMLKVAS